MTRQFYRHASAAGVMLFYGAVWMKFVDWSQTEINTVSLKLHRVAELFVGAMNVVEQTKCAIIPREPLRIQNIQATATRLTL